MIDHFLTEIDDDMSIEEVGWVAYTTDPNPTGMVTRGELSSESAKAMQYSIRQQQDAEAEIERLEGLVSQQKEAIKEQNARIAHLEATDEERLAAFMRLTRELHDMGVIKTDHLAGLN
jgi:uncharacterized coiled-coil protein SlyX